MTNHSIKRCATHGQLDAGTRKGIHVPCDWFMHHKDEWGCSHMLDKMWMSASRLGLSFYVAQIHPGRSGEKNLNSDNTIIIESNYSPHLSVSCYDQDSFHLGYECHAVVTSQRFEERHCLYLRHMLILWRWSPDIFLKRWNSITPWKSVISQEN
jgi:hypothetical protein